MKKEEVLENITSNIKLHSGFILSDEFCRSIAESILDDLIFNKVKLSKLKV